MSSYQGFEPASVPSESPAGNPPDFTEQGGAYGSEYQQSSENTDYSHYFNDESESFDIKSPRTILRFVELFCVMIAFSVASSVKHYDKLPQAENQVLINVFAFIYIISIVAADVMRIKSKFFPNLDLFEFALDLMFFVLTFFAAAALATKSNKKKGGLKYCEFYGDISKKTGKGDGCSPFAASEAFGFFASFCLAASVFFSYKRVAQSRA